MSFPQIHDVSYEDGLQYQAAGGNWWATAFNVGNATHISYQTRQVARTVLIYAQSAQNLYFKIDNVSTDSISAANDYIIRGSVNYVLELPISQGQRPYLHFKQVSPASPAKLRIVER